MVPPPSSSRTASSARRMPPSSASTARLMLVLACGSSRRYFLDSELPTLDGQDILRVAPGPWDHRDVPTVHADTTLLPDDLLIPALKALMKLPGAAQACDPLTRRPRADATEYCLAVYRTPEDWRVSWPVRNLSGERSACNPPFGGVEDADFGRDMPIFGFAHNHPCGTAMSSADLRVSPAMRAPEGHWTLVEYAVTPVGGPARDSTGRPIPAWAWLATGPIDAPHLFKWNLAGEVQQWDEGARRRGTSRRPANLDAPATSRTRFHPLVANPPWTR